MYLSVTNIVKSFFTSNFKQNTQKSIDSQDNDEHTYIRGDIADRGPCPGLNALANQGYLPRDGKNITLPQVQHALMTVLHMDKTAAAALTHSLPPLCGKDGTFDLVDTRRHNVIEHDSSFTRLDFHQGDNYTFQPDMFRAMLDDANGGPVTRRTLAKTFIRRNKESRAAGAPRLPLNLWFVRLLQAVGVMNTAQTGGTLSKELLEAVFVEERFPDVILDNPKPRTVFTLLGNALGMLWYVIIGP
ncbi:Cloroperoxidase [Lophium mytilinum]|uniref:Cloroperoxidase n=1 Tax=Lophium mytilinum TaxID=390894 RepID=A0A6A6QMW5_9PEZI|nr:Cloroperoxidase [Lophium mytilinum]